ncbi:MAG: DUF3302 domain-containing protein [Desulfobacterales bacterium]|nr:DUF3302 domain-containing protein [Desulfobacterales bacterium]
MGDRTLDFIALGTLFFVVITLIYGIIYIHDIPYEIAKKRKHPHQDAIHTAGWVSLFLMHTVWPFLWIWATLYKPGFGWGFSQTSEAGGDHQTTSELQDRISQLETLYQAKIVLIDISIKRLMNRVGLHLSLGGSFTSNKTI